MMHRRGFTLIEVMIAMMIFSIITVMTFQALQTSMNVQQRVEDKAAVFNDVQLLMTLMHEDFAGLVRRPVRGVFGDERRAAFNLEVEALNGREKSYANCPVEFTRAGSQQGSKELRSGLVRVAYCLDEDNDLYRLVWPILDPAQGSFPVESLLIKSVAEFSLDLDEADAEEWGKYCDYPPDELPDECQQWLPGRVITVTLGFDTLSGVLEFTRDFPVGMGLYLWKREP